MTNDPVPAATSFTTSSLGLNAETLNCVAADPGAPGLAIAGYAVEVFSDAGASNLFKTQWTSGTGTTATIDGLTADTPFWFTVAAKNTGPNPLHGVASAVLGPRTPQGALVANAGFDQAGVVRNTAVTLSGAGSTVTGAMYAWTQILTGTQTALAKVTWHRFRVSRRTSGSRFRSTSTRW